MHVRCPQCHSRMGVDADDLSGVLECSSCGSSFELVSGRSTGPNPPLVEEDTESYRSVTETIGKFRLIEEVGAGKVGTVWKAYDTQLDRTVAVKIPRSGRLDDIEVEQFFREARAAAQVQHPNIVSVHEVGRENDRIYIVSDFVQGANLKEYLSGQGLSFRETAELCATIADALHAAHEAGVVHRDLKPQNIMMSADGTPHVADFGLAKRDAGEITMTVEGQLLGTPAYMPPEQIETAHQADRRSDVYSLGVVLYELLTGVLPFRGTRRMLMIQVLEHEPRAPRTLNDHIPRDLETITLKAMAKEPGRRYPTASDMAADLRRWLAGEPILARPVGRAERLWRWCRRKPAVAGLTAAALLLLVAVTVISTAAAIRLDRLADRQRELTTAAVRSANTALRERNAARSARDREARERRRAEMLQAESALQTGSLLCAAGEVDRGMLWFARSLEALPPDTPALEFEIRGNMALWRQWMLSLRWSLPHEPGSGANTVAFSPDGQKILTASFDGTARLWNAMTGEPLVADMEHPEQLQMAAFSPDGTRVMTGCDDGKLRFWNAATGQRVGDPVDLGDLIRLAEYASDGKRAVARTNDSLAHVIHDADTDAPRAEPIPRGESTAAAYSPSRDLIAVAGRDQVVRFYDPGTASFTSTRLEHPAQVELLRFRPDGRVLLTAGDVVRLWHLDDGRQLGPPLPHSMVVDAAFTPDGRQVATGGLDRRCVLWDVATGRSLLELPHAQQVHHVAFSPGGELLVTGSAGVVRLWDVRTGAAVGQPLRDASITAFHPDGTALLSGSQAAAAQLWELDLGAAVPRYLAHRQMTRRVAFSRDGRRLLTADQGRSAQLWVASSGEPLGSPFSYDHSVDIVAFSPDGQRFVTGSWSGDGHLGDVKTGEPVGRIEHDGAIFAAAFTPDGELLVTGGNDGIVRFWDGRTGESRGQIEVGATGVRILRISADGRTLLTTGFEPAAALWDLDSRQPRGEPLRHAATSEKLLGVVNAMFSPDGAFVLTADNHGRAMLWDAATGDTLPGPAIEHEAGISAVAMSSDGRFVVTGSFDHTARVWDVAAGTLLTSVQHDDAVTAVGLSPDDRILITGGADNTARLWSVESGRPLGPPIPHIGRVAVAEFSPAGGTLVTGHSTLRLASFAPVGGDAEQVRRWVQVATGQEIAGDGTVRILDSAAWQARRRQLDESGWPAPRLPGPLSSLRSTDPDEPGPFGPMHISSHPVDGKRLLWMGEAKYEVSNPGSTSEIGPITLAERIVAAPRTGATSRTGQELSNQEMLNRAEFVLRSDSVGAMTLCGQVLDREPNNRDALRLLALGAQFRAEQLAGFRAEESRALFVRAAGAMRQLAAAYPEMSDLERRLRVQTLYDETTAHALADDAPKALASLKDCLDAGFGDIERLEQDEDLASIRSMPEFRELVDRLRRDLGAPPDDR